MSERGTARRLTPTHGRGRWAVLALGAALVLGGAAAAHGEIILFLPIFPGPSGYVGPHMPSRPTAALQPPVRITSEPPLRARDRAPLLPPGEPDETGRIGPTAHVEHDADGKILPTYRPR